MAAYIDCCWHYGTHVEFLYMEGLILNHQALSVCVTFEARGDTALPMVQIWEDLYPTTPVTQFQFYKLALAWLTLQQWAQALIAHGDSLEMCKTTDAEASPETLIQWAYSAAWQNGKSSMLEGKSWLLWLDYAKLPTIQK